MSVIPSVHGDHHEIPFPVIHSQDVSCFPGIRTCEGNREGKNTGTRDHLCAADVHIRTIIVSA